MKSALEKRSARIWNIEQKYSERLHQAQNQRLIVAGLFFLSLIVYAMYPEFKAVLYSIPVFIAVFSYLVGKCNRLKRFRTQLNSLAQFYDRQSLRQRGLAVTRNWQEALDAVKDSADMTTIQDLNLIGPHSLFTSIDETVSDGGRKTLASWMTVPELDRSKIIERQKNTRGLAKLRWFFIRLLNTASEAEGKLSTKAVEQILAYPFLTSKTKKTALFSMIAWVIAVALLIASKVTEFGHSNLIVVGYMVIGLMCLNRIGPIFLRGEGLSLQLASLATIFARIESRIANPSLKAIMPTVAEQMPSKSVAHFNRILNFQSVESNALFYLVLNSFIPWAAFFSYLLENAREKIAAQFPECLKEFNHLEAQASLVFVNIYQTNTFPEIIADSEKPVFEAKALFHPLIDRSKVVANDFAFAKGKVLGLLTGSNMSGKSTFLRTLGINQTLANMGAPVFAQSLTTSVLNVRSCIQVSDSLRDGFSYFYSEVIRLKSLMDDVKNGKRTLFLVDEIFRGTNNRERQIGSQAVITSLCEGTHSLGFVSTHDLELTALEDSLPGLTNLHFRENMNGDEMHFTYRLQHGPCTTTNALVIMKNAGFALGSH
jgi:Mismatch repair ATPase (MutS family)